MALTNLKTKKTALESRLLDKGVRNYSGELALLIDDYLFTAYEKSTTGLKIGIINNPYAVIALGSYGRSEPAVRSDIALMLLFEKTIPEEAEELVREIIYPLWDAGFEVTHVIRTVNECITTAGNDIDVLMSLMDGRFICGMSRLFFELYDTLRKTVVTSRMNRIISMIIEKNHGRHDRYGDSSYLLEPNIMDGQGGLGDYYAMLSVARIKSNLRLPRDLEYSGYVSEKEYDDLSMATGFILNVRNMLHAITGRKCDQLYLDYQKRIADLTGYRKTDSQEAVEHFLGDLHGKMEIIKQQYKVFILELGFAENPVDGSRILSKKSRVKGIDVCKKNLLHFSSVEGLMESPELLVKIFGESAGLKIPLGTDAKRLVRDFSGKIINDTFRKSRSVVRAFEKVLLTPAPEFNVLEEMLRTGFLCEFIPEFNGIINRIQYNDYHISPVDKHSLKTVQTAKLFSLGKNGDSEFQCIYNDLEDTRPLLWACLLHDIGKCELNGRHSETGAEITKTIMARFGYNAQVIETVSFLVAEHLFLIKMATRRDINDEETAVFCARRINSEEHLKMLYLLSIADSMATGPKAWNNWTASLIKDLYHKTLNILRKGEFEPSEAVGVSERKKQELEALFLQEHQDTHGYVSSLKHLSLRYILNVPVDLIQKHIALYSQLKQSDFAWTIETDPSSKMRIVTVCAKNRPGLFSKIAGVLTLSGFDILDAQIHTWKNGIALDIFHISPPADTLFEHDKWLSAENELRSVLKHDLNLSVRINEMIETRGREKSRSFKTSTSIKIDNDTSGYFTIIEVHTPDFSGLLFTITDTLFKCGLDVFIAKIATKADQVVDTFYVRNFYGEKVLSDEQISRITTTLTQVINSETATLQGR